MLLFFHGVVGCSAADGEGSEIRVVFASTPVWWRWWDGDVIRDASWRDAGRGNRRLLIGGGGLLRRHGLLRRRCRVSVCAACGLPGCLCLRRMLLGLLLLHDVPAHADDTHEQHDRRQQRQPDTPKPWLARLALTRSFCPRPLWRWPL